MGDNRVKKGQIYRNTYRKAGIRYGIHSDGNTYQPGNLGLLFYTSEQGGRLTVYLLYAGVMWDSPLYAVNTIG